MSAWTNVTLPNRFSLSETLRERIVMLQCELDLKDKKISYLEKEFENIPEAIKQYGYVDLSDHKGKFIMRLVDGSPGALSGHTTKAKESES